MGFMDKAKEAALQAQQKAQHLAQQGQAKVADVQQHRTEAELYRTLGEAFYAEQRRGGDKDAVVAALTALDEHFAGTAAPGTPGEASGTATGGPAAPAGGDAGTPPPTDTPPATGGNFTFDNL